MISFREFLEKKSNFFIGVTSDPKEMDVIYNNKLIGHIKDESPDGTSKYKGMWKVYGITSPNKKLDVTKYIHIPKILNDKVKEFFGVK